ncbi:protein eva-1 homolog C isoform X1 [Colossoma macropomum]|uniref:protein eva-1 homolog C isoform X1 n=2 Tax=Colossoma macropomum TaxID=42526 RepID=UPI0018649A21|nr:protein eva-1 homolog C isoform X1 [Colossoma macropomum]
MSHGLGHQLSSSRAFPRLTVPTRSSMSGPDASSSGRNLALFLGITCLAIFSKTSAELSGYLSRVLRNYTEEACDGDILTVRCPPRTTITVQSAFYGRRDSAHSLQCPLPYNIDEPHPLSDDSSCHVSTALQKMSDECQDRRSCELLVNSRLFGTDPCPSISKSLTLQYKCRPNEYKSKVVCEGERLRLSCKNGMQIAVYSVMFGRTQQGTLECPPHHRRAPFVDCQSEVALQVMTSRCQGKRACVIRASTQVFGDPCYSGTRKYLSVIYTCVPKKLLQESVQRLPFAPPPSQTHDPNVVGDSAPPDGNPSLTSDPAPGKSKRGKSGSYLEKNRFANGQKETEREREENRDKEKETRDQTPTVAVATATSTEMALISNALAAYTYITEHPERCALYFMCGVCAGLFLTLFALVVQISCRTDCRRRHAVSRKRPRPAESESDSSGSDSDWDSGSDLSARRHRRFERTLNTNIFTSAEELERAQRLEERERIIREIWMNGQPDIPGTRSLNRYY